MLRLQLLPTDRSAALHWQRLARSVTNYAVDFEVSA